VIDINIIKLIIIKDMSWQKFPPLTNANVEEIISRLNSDIRYYESILVPCVTRSFDIDAVIREHKRAKALLRTAMEFVASLS
jgi:hypothetical protein